MFTDYVSNTYDLQLYFVSVLCGLGTGKWDRSPRLLSVCSHTALSPHGSHTGHRTTHDRLTVNVTQFGRQIGLLLLSNHGKTNQREYLITQP